MLIPPINDHKFDQRSYGEAVGAAPDTHLPHLPRRLRRLRPHVNKKASNHFNGALSYCQLRGYGTVHLYWNDTLDGRAGDGA